MNAVILVGGEGTRLRPLTLNVPKAIVPVVNKPLILYILKWLRKYGIKEVILVACYLPDKLKKILNKEKHGMNIKYIYEEKPLGTGGAIKRAEKFITKTTVVMNGDILTDLNLDAMRKFHNRKKSTLTIALTPVENASAYGVVETNPEEKVLRFIEKPSLDELSGKKANINAGVYLIEPLILSLMQKGKVYSIERDIFPRLVGNKFYGFISNRIYWMDVGTAEKYKRVSHDILKGSFKVGNLNLISSKAKFLKGSKVYRPISIWDGTVIGECAKIGELSVIGKDCRIGKNTILERCIIWNNVRIGENCALQDCVIGDNCEIGNFSYLSGNLVVGCNTIISPYSKLKT